MKVKIGVASDVSGFLSSPEKSRRVQVPMRQPKLVFDQKKYEDSKFLFQRNIVFNPKNAESYLYLAKIYKNEKNEKEEIKNLNTTLLLDPTNEEAMHLMINYELKKSNYSKVKKLKESFLLICKKLCEEVDQIDKSLADIEPKNGSEQ